MNTRILLITLTALFIAAEATAQTEISGEISGRLTIDESPYLATDSLIIPAGESLRIDPGVEIFFADKMALMVFGRLEAVGTEEDSIWLRAFDPENGARWAGITIDHADEGSQISYCDLENTGWRVPNRHFSSQFGRSLTILNTTVDVSNSLFSGCVTDDAIYVYCYPNHEPVTFTGNTITNNRNGLAIISCNNILVERNEVYSNDYTGMKLWGCYYAKVTGNLVEFNRTGIELRGANNFVLNNIIRDNGIEGSGYGLITGSAIIIGNEITSSQDGGFGGRCNITGRAILVDNLFANKSGIYEGQGLSIAENIRHVLLNRSVVANYGNGGLRTGQKTRLFIQNSICRRFGQFDITKINPFYSNMPSDQFIGEGVFSEDPLFVNRDNDYHLQDRSPCIGTGNPHPFFRNSDRSRPDMGYYNAVEGNDLVFGFTTHYQFPTIGTHNVATDSFLFCNLSEEPIRLASMELSDHDNFSLIGEAPLDLEPFVWYWFPIIFNPIEPGDHQATIEFTFEDYEPIDHASITLSGTSLDGMSGYVSGVLRRQFSPYHVIADIEVPWLDTLIIEPGVELRFDPGVKIECLRAYSAIIAEGTEADSIRFVSSVENPEQEDYWRGLYDVKGILKYCLVEHAQDGLWAFDGTISNSTVKNCTREGISLWSHDRLSTASHCRVYNCEIGVSVWPMTRLEYSTVTNCQRGVDHVDGGELFRNLIAYNEKIVLAFSYDVGWDEENWVIRSQLEAIGNIFYKNDSLLNEDWPLDVFQYNTIFESPAKGIDLVGELVQENVNGIPCDENFNFNADPRLLDPEHFSFELLEDSPCIDAGSDEWEPDPDGSVADIGPLYFDHELPPGQFIQVANGWSIVSLNVFPLEILYAQDEDRGPDPVRLFEPFEDRLMIVKDDVGRFYIPGQNHFINIPFWNLANGYKVKTSEPIRLFWEGDHIPPDRPIPLREGWNIAAYYPQYRLSVNAPDFYGFESILEHLVIAKDQYGNFALPNRRFSGLPLLAPGQGYQLKLDENAELIYPPVERNIVMQDGLNRPVHYHSEVTQANMSILLEGSGEIGEITGEIAAFNNSGICIGAAVFQSQNSKLQVGLPVWEDDPTTAKIDGAQAGDTLIFKLWDGSTEHNLRPDWVEGNGVYQSDSYAVGNILNADLLFTPATFSLSPPFPNPFNSSTTITFGLDKSAPTRLAVYDLSGRLVKGLVNGPFAAGSHKIIWNAADMPVGIYMVRLEQDNLTATQKIVLLK